MTAGVVPSTGAAVPIGSTYQADKHSEHSDPVSIDGTKSMFFASLSTGDLDTFVAAAGTDGVIEVDDLGRGNLYYKTPYIIGARYVDGEWKNDADIVRGARPCSMSCTTHLAASAQCRLPTDFRRLV